MIILKDKADCCGCSACANICPKQCITMQADKEGFVYPLVDRDRCINCDLCKKVCPLINTPEQHPIINVYAAKSSDDEIRFYSSSGGIFTEIAKGVLENGGIVFGAELDEDFSVYHSCAEKPYDLAKFRGSKYVQSNLKRTFEQTKVYLSEKRKVLYSGTPCQIAGLKNYLIKDFENLYTVDVVCHGVPSPAVYRKYLDELAEEAGAAIVKVSFRDKHKGWKRGETVFTTEKAVFAASKRRDPYMKLFLNNVIIRPSCAECAFNNKRSRADITIADFWGIDKFHPEFDDDKGTTLVMINSLKGQQLFENIKDNITYISCTFEEAAAYNVAVSRSLNLHEKRQYFFDNYHEKKIKALCAEILEDK